MSMEEKELLVWGFDKPGELEQWRPINDVVMGGVSESVITAGSKVTALFSGTVSLENFGGFASVSSQPADYNLSGYEGIAVRIKGDGKRYKFNIKTDAVFTGFSYQAAFTAENGTWAVIQLPFDTLVPTFRGRVVSSAEKLDRKKITSFGFLIADKQQGPFRLEIDWIKAYK